MLPNVSVGQHFMRTRDTDNAPFAPDKGRMRGLSVMGIDANSRILCEGSTWTSIEARNSVHW